MGYRGIGSGPVGSSSFSIGVHPWWRRGAKVGRVLGVECARVMPRTRESRICIRTSRYVKGRGGEGMPLGEALPSLVVWKSSGADGICPRNVELVWKRLKRNVNQNHAHTYAGISFCREVQGVLLSGSLYAYSFCWSRRRRNRSGVCRSR